MTELNEQMEMFEIEKDEASKKLDKGVSDLKEERKVLVYLLIIFCFNSNILWIIQHFFWYTTVYF